MRLPAPRIIVIDDEPKHLQGLVHGLNQYGAACLPIHFTSEQVIRPCSLVRVIFADLHLSDLPSGNYNQDFAMIGSLIEDIQPSGPYFVVLWTMYPEQASALHRFLAERLRNVAKPFTVHKLDKNDHLDVEGNVKDPEMLVQAIEGIVTKQPQIGALLNWEERVLDGAADTLSSIMKMAESVPDRPGEELGRLLRILAEGAVGRDHVEDDRFRAVNDALLPILADRLASMRLQESNDQLWKDALKENNQKDILSEEKAAKLNRFLHIASLNNSQYERGAVITLPQVFIESGFAQKFNIPEDEAAEKQFLFDLSKEDDHPLAWVLVQTQAACDYAQSKPGPLPFYLGLYLPESKVNKIKTGKKKGERMKGPDALWCSPCFEHEQQVQYLHVNARFPVSLSREEVNQTSSLFRLREQLLNDLIYHLHGYGARPGIISFRS